MIGNEIRSLLRSNYFLRSDPDPAKLRVAGFSGAPQGLIMGLASMGRFFYGVGIILAAAIVSALIFFGVRFFKEAALILADIGDSITEVNSKSVAP